MHINEVVFAKHWLPRVPGPILEVGSREYPEKGRTAQDVYRRLWPENHFVGLDLSDGPNVDVVGDLTQGLCGMDERSFALVICCAVLEHVRQPRKMAENIERLLVPGGKVYVSVPWVWRFHAYPDDYWRISWAGIESIFPNIIWNDPIASGNVPGTFWNLKNNPNIDDDMSILKGEQKFLPYLMTLMIGERK